MTDESKSINSLEILYKDFYHPNPNINFHACREMAKYWPKESMQRLIDNLSGEDVELRRKSVRCLGCFGEKVFFPVSKLFYSSNNLITQISCIKVFVKLASDMQPDKFPEELFNIINIAIKDEEPQMILVIVSLLRQLDYIGKPYLQALCRDSNLLKARASVTAISELRDSSISNFLIELSEDKSIDPFIREAAYFVTSMKK